MKPQDTIRTDRRGFFKRVAGAGLASAGALVLTRTGAHEPAPPAGAQAQPEQAGRYRETDHVRRYYDVARF